MCGIVAAVTQRNIINFLLQSIHRLEYRGYDSAGVAIIDKNNNLLRVRCVGKVNKLIKKTKNQKLFGKIGLAHTRWATHGKVSEENTHPHVSSHISIVHNGIIENSLKIRLFLEKQGYIFYSDTDTEVIVHFLHWEQKKTGKSLIEIMHNSLKKLHGNYSMVVMDNNNSSTLIAVCSGSPLIIGLGRNENFVASDQIALLNITKRFIYLKEGDIAIVKSEKTKIFDKNNYIVKRKIIESNVKYEYVKKGSYKHYMEKEIYEQPMSIRNTLKNRLKNNKTIYLPELGSKEQKILLNVEHIQIVACGTSYNAAMVSKHWFESLAQVPCDVEVASEFNSRKLALRRNSFFITLSQSGETADTLKALRMSKHLGYIGNLTICNMKGSSLVQESDTCLLTNAGIEIGVASTKSFTTQLTVLLMLVAKIISIKEKKK